MSPLAMKDLRPMIARGCQVPGCSHKDHGPTTQIDLSASCHVGTGVKLTLHVDGTLAARCAYCGQPVARFQVAEGSRLDRPLGTS